MKQGERASGDAMLDDETGSAARADMHHHTPHRFLPDFRGGLEAIVMRQLIDNRAVAAERTLEQRTHIRCRKCKEESGSTVRQAQSNGHLAVGERMLSADDPVLSAAFPGYVDHSRELRVRPQEGLEIARVCRDE